MLMRLSPKGDKPYLFGLHHCAEPRHWTTQEKRLFEEIGRRLTDALTGLGRSSAVCAKTSAG